MPITDVPQTADKDVSLASLLDSKQLGGEMLASRDGVNKLRILVVEDERIVARDLQVRLANLGKRMLSDRLRGTVRILF